MYDSLLKDLNDGCIGDVRVIQVNFGDNVFGTTNVKRVTDKSLGGKTSFTIHPSQFFVTFSLMYLSITLFYRVLHVQYIVYTVTDIHVRTIIVMEPSYFMHYDGKICCY